MAGPRFCLVDTHAHLADPVFEADRAAVLERARQAGVGAIVSVSEDLQECGKNLDLSVRHPEIRIAAGLHPSRPDLDQARVVAAWIRRERPRIAAVGEVGLDHWVVPEGTARELQEEVFRLFVDLARDLDLPLNIHSRSAGRQTIALLLAKNAVRVQLHAFDGKAASAMPAVEAGYFFSIPPSVVRSRQKQKLVRQLPISSLLIETDSPVLGPSAEERNEPAQAWTALNAIAEIKGVSREEVMEKVFENTLRVYGQGLFARAPSGSLGAEGPSQGL